VREACGDKERIASYEVNTFVNLSYGRNEWIPESLKCWIAFVFLYFACGIFLLGLCPLPYYSYHPFSSLHIPTSSERLGSRRVVLSVLAKRLRGATLPCLSLLTLFYVHRTFSFLVGSVRLDAHTPFVMFFLFLRTRRLLFYLFVVPIFVQLDKRHTRHCDFEGNNLDRLITWGFASDGNLFCGIVGSGGAGLACLLSRREIIASCPAGSRWK